MLKKSIFISTLSLYAALFFTGCFSVDADRDAYEKIKAAKDKPFSEKTWEEKDWIEKLKTYGLKPTEEQLSVATTNRYRQYWGITKEYCEKKVARIKKEQEEKKRIEREKLAKMLEEGHVDWKLLK